MKQLIDLTTSSGVRAAMALLNGNPLAAALFLMKDVFSANDPEKQSKTVTELIKAGRDQGVREMEIKLKTKNGLSINIPGCDVTTFAGSDGNICLKVKYYR